MIRKQIPFFLLLVFLFAHFSPYSQTAIYASGDSIGKFEVIELVIKHPQSYSNNWEDVNISASFINIDTIKVCGFFYDTNVWKLRFAPGKTGAWKYQVSFNTPLTSYQFSGLFTCIDSDKKGHLQQHPGNPFRLIYSDGTLFNGIGIGDCILDSDGDGTVLNDWGFDGEHRQGNYLGSVTNLNNYMHAYGSDGAGFNLFRWSTDNCSFKLFNTISAGHNDYNIQSGKWGDSLMTQVKRNNMSVWLTIFNDPVFKNIRNSSPDEEGALKKYISYLVARYGVYVDIWELYNENSASEYWINLVSNTIKAINPYKNLITVSDPRPELKAIEITSPHWYEKEPEEESDRRAFEMITNYRKWKKPIIFGEQGNAVQNWDMLSGQRMRVRSWTAFFAEGTWIFWNTSAVKDYKHERSANLYIGPLERGYINALQKFTSTADSAVMPFTLNVLNANSVRSYGLRSEKMILGYFFHSESQSNYSTTSFYYRMRKGGIIQWIDPVDNRIILSERILEGRQNIISPPFKIDLAMRIVLDSLSGPIDAEKKLLIELYPNPATDYFTIEGNFYTLTHFELFDETGRSVRIYNNLIDHQVIPVKNLKKGFYSFRAVSFERRTCTGKLIIE